MYEVPAFNNARRFRRTQVLVANPPSLELGTTLMVYRFAVCCTHALSNAQGNVLHVPHSVHLESISRGAITWAGGI